jgi:hypothetical protein
LRQLAIQHQASSGPIENLLLPDAKPLLSIECEFYYIFIPAIDQAYEAYSRLKIFSAFHYCQKIFTTPKLSYEIIIYTHENVPLLVTLLFYYRTGQDENISNQLPVELLPEPLLQIEQQRLNMPPELEIMKKKALDPSW